MTSAINTNGLSTQYPVAGVNNSTQGFRDNFNNIKQNLDTAASELTDLQAKAIFKSALNGAALNNDMAGTVIKNAQTQGFRGTGKNLGTNLSGPIVIDVNVADVYYGALNGAGDVTLSFAKWAPTGTLSQVRTIFTANANITGNIILPSQVDSSRLSVEGIGGSNNFTIFPESNSNPVLDLLFSTVDCGNTVTVTQMNRTGKASQIQTRALNPVGQVGDVVGSIVYSNAQLYIATANYDGTSNIWSQVGSNGGGGSGYLSSIANGTANVVTFTNANVAISAGGSANRMVVSNVGVNALGNFTTTGNISALAILANGNLTTFGYFTANQTANFSGAVNLFNTALSTGTGNISGGNLSLLGSAGITGNISVTGNTAISGNANIALNFRANNITANNFANIGGNLTANNIVSNNNTTSMMFTTTEGGNLRIQANVSGSTRKITIQANSNAAFSSDYTLTLPTTPGQFGQLLSTDGAGNLSWINVGAGNLSNGSSSVTIANSANITFTVTGTARATISATGINVNGSINTASTVNAASLIGTANLLVNGASTSNLISTGGNLNLLANAGVINMSGNVVIANASGNANNGYLRAALVANTLPNGYVPSSNGASGVLGTITYDASYVYVCLGANKWMRIEGNLTW